MFIAPIVAQGESEIFLDPSSAFLNEEDVQALRDWIATKRQVTIKQVGGDLSISGEVRMEMQNIKEVKNGKKQRGAGSANETKPGTQYDIEVNLMLDYRMENNWASIKLEFDNNAGSDLNIFDNIAIERAILGMRIINGETVTIDLEGGRRNMGTMYDSKIEFGSFLDGFTLKYDLASDRYGNFYARFSPFLVNEIDYIWGLVGEIGILNIFNTGFYAKYSIIDWDTKNFGGNKAVYNRLYGFVNSQWILGYKFVPKWINQVTTLYSAFLINTAARGIALTHYKKANLAWYAGFSMGKVRNKGDWSLDINWQYVQAQAVPVIDASGIGRGNSSAIGFYTQKITNTNEIIEFSTAVGKANYKGISIQLLYLLTDTITIFQSYQQAVNANKNIGAKAFYRQYEIELIYAF